MGAETNLTTAPCLVLPAGACLPRLSAVQFMRAPPKGGRRMKHGFFLLASVGLTALLTAGLSAPLPAQAPKALVYNFDGDTTGKPPARFHFARTGQGAEGTWVVMADATAPSKPNVLAQTSTDTTDYRFPLAVLDEGSYQDVAVSVKFKAVAGKVDQAGGIIFRYQD